MLTADSTFVLMTAADFEPLVEGAFDDFDESTTKESQAFVNVGWGKKETQVGGHGSRVVRWTETRTRKSECV